MKKIMIIVIAFVFVNLLSLCLIISTAFAGSWNGWVYQNPYPTKNTLLSVKFITPQKGWVVGEHGTILYTEDGGENWETQESGTEEDLKSVTFVNDKVGWAVGNGGVTIHTEDGGKKWERQGDTKDHLHNIFFLNENEGWIGGSMGTFLHTKDGGKNWNKEDIGSYADVAGIFFLNPNTGWVLAGGKVYRTRDEGKSWEVSELPAVKFPEPRGIARPTDHGWEGSAFFINEKRGLVTVGFDYFFQTEDGGKTWKATKVSNSVDRIAFTDEKNGCMAGASIFCTEDGGSTWKERLGAKPGDAAMLEGYRVAIWGLSFANRTTGWAVGAWGGQIFKTEDGGKSWKAESRKYRWDVYFLDSKTGWATQYDYKQNKGSIVKIEDSGNTWEVQKEFDNNVDIRFFFINPTTGWAVGHEIGDDRYKGPLVLNYFIIHTSDGGKTWTTQFKKTGKELRNSDDLVNIFFISPDIGWAVGSNGLILHTKDSGKHWARQRSGAKLHLRCLHFVSAEKGWIIGNKERQGRAGLILYTKDGGNHWQQQWKKESEGLWLKDIFFTDENAGWIIGDSSEYGEDNILVHTVDGGKTWVEKEFKETYFDQMFFLDKDRGVILTEKGQMLITQDGGKTWDKKRIPIRKYPWHVSEIFKKEN